MDAHPAVSKWLIEEAEERFGILPAIEKHLMPLSPHEKEWLTQSLIEEGCREPIVLWRLPPELSSYEGVCKGSCSEGSISVDPSEWEPGIDSWQCSCGYGIAPFELVILDGHNRYRICKREGIEFDYVETDLHLPTLEDALDWADRNQAGRRNSPPDDYRILTGRIYNRRKKKHGANQHSERSPQIEDSSRESSLGSSPKKTSSAVAEEFGISKASVERNGQRAALYDAMVDQGDEEAAEAIKTAKQSVVEEVYKKPKEQQAAEAKASKAVHVSQNTGMPEWYTPPEFIEAARSVLRRIDTDPASSDIAQKTVKATTYFTVDDDGLAQEWIGTVWMNPPYTAGLVDKFAEKLRQSYESGSVSAAIVLVNNATDTRWFQSLCCAASAVCFPCKRIKFLDQNGNPGAPLQGQAIIYLGTKHGTFCKEFSAFGFCCEVVR